MTNKFKNNILKLFKQEQGLKPNPNHLTKLEQWLLQQLNDLSISAPTQQSFNAIGDLRPYLLEHKDSAMVKSSCLHFLGDSHQQQEAHTLSKKSYWVLQVIGSGIRTPQKMYMSDFNPNDYSDNWKTPSIDKAYKFDDVSLAQDIARATCDVFSIVEVVTVTYANIH